jgi:hypothetical protein
MGCLSADQLFIATQIQVDDVAGGVLEDQDAVFGLSLCERLGGFCYLRK